MPGEIKHYWVGTTLMVESDAGVSGCDLKGQTGDIGPRGPQGPAGVVVDGGNIDIDLTGYATEAYVDNAIANAELGGGDVDLSNYATKTYVDTAVSANRQELTNYATKTYVDNAVANAGGGGNTTDMSNYYTKSELDAVLLEKPTYDWVVELHNNSMPPTETWFFTLEDGTVISKVVSLG